MKCFRIIRTTAVALATLGTVIPNAPVLAAGSSVTSKANVKVVDAKVFDIAMTNGGTFGGRVVDHTGAVMEGAEVTIRQNDKEVARTVTDKQGSFSVKNLKSGVYTVSSGATVGTYRLWTENTAPPSAKEQGLLVMGENGTRGNFGCCCCDPTGPILLAVGALSVAAIIVGSIALSNANRALDKPASP